jgi:hypothetical protein
MRDFSAADRLKKNDRIKLPDNPGNLSAETRSQVEHAIKAALHDGYVRLAADYCASAWLWWWRIVMAGGQAGAGAVV